MDEGGKVDFLLFVCLMVFNDTFNNISVILWQSVLIMALSSIESSDEVTFYSVKLLHNKGR